jgi:hypothetical protein
MIIIESIDPNAVCVKTVEVLTNKGLVTIGESEALSYVQDLDGNLYIGSDGTVLRVTHKTSFQDLSKVIKPAAFSLIVEEDGEISLKATIEDHKDPYIPSISDRKFKNVADIVSIRGLEGVLI